MRISGFRIGVWVVVLMGLTACQCDAPTVNPPPPTPDVTAPTWPDGAQVVVSATTASSATLTWPAAVDDVGVEAYVVAREGVVLTEVPGLTFTADALTPGQHQRFTVAARDAAGNLSTLLSTEVAPAKPFTAPDDGGATVSTNFCAAPRFLVDGPDAPQQGVTAPSPCENSGLLHGRATTPEGVGIPGVTVSLVQHPEFGHVVTSADGTFSLLLPAGWWTVDFSASAFVPLQRAVDVSVGDFTVLDTVALLRRDEASTVVVTAAGGYHESTPREDSDGRRHVGLYLPAGTEARARLADGGTPLLPSVTLRVTEVTAGPAAERTMSATLPPTSAFTFAADFSVDEALSAGASGVTFSGPVAFYVDDFLHSKPGTWVPQGSYDTTTGRWEAQPNAIVVRVLAGGALDLDDDGVADTALTLLPGEAAALAAHVAPGTVV